MPQDRVPSGSTDLFFSFFGGGAGKERFQMEKKLESEFSWTLQTWLNTFSLSPLPSPESHSVALVSLELTMRVRLASDSWVPPGPCL